MYANVDDIVVEDTSKILARRQKEDALTARMQELITGFDKYLEEKEKKRLEDPDERAVDSLIDSLCKGGPADVRDGCTVDAATWKPAEQVTLPRRCFRAFSSDSLTLSLLAGPEAAPCNKCSHLTGTWQQLLPHVEAYSQQVFVHKCPAADAFPRFLFFAMSVCDDGDANDRLYHAAIATRFDPSSMLDDILTVLYNWGFDDKILDYNLEEIVELQRLISESGRKEDEEPLRDEVEAARALEKNTDNDETDFPISSQAVSNTLKYFLLKLPYLDVETQEVEDKALAVLRAFSAALADRSLVVCGAWFRPIIYKVLDRMRTEKWSDEKYLKLVKKLHVLEFSVFGQYKAVQPLVDRPVRDDRSALKGCVGWAVLQLLHGVDQHKVEYVIRLRPELFKKLPPGPLTYSQLSPKELYLSLLILGDCASSAAREDATDPAFYGELMRHAYRLQQELPRMSVMDSNIIKCQLVHLDFFLKSLTSELLERQGRPNSLLSYMRQLLQH